LELQEERGDFVLKKNRREDPMPTRKKNQKDELLKPTCRAFFGKHHKWALRKTVPSVWENIGKIKARSRRSTGRQGGKKGELEREQVLQEPVKKGGGNRKRWPEC